MNVNLRKKHRVIWILLALLLPLLVVFAYLFIPSFK